MNRSKCITCKHYNSFFGSCDLYCEEVYVGDGDFDVIPTNIKYVNKSECKHKLKELNK